MQDETPHHPNRSFPLRMGMEFPFRYFAISAGSTGAGSLLLYLRLLLFPDSPFWTQIHQSVIKIARVTFLPEAHQAFPIAIRIQPALPSVAYKTCMPSGPCPGALSRFIWDHFHLLCFGPGVSQLQPMAEFS